MTVHAQADDRMSNPDSQAMAATALPAEDAASEPPVRPWRAAFAAALPAWLTGTLLVIVMAELAAYAERNRSPMGLSAAFANEHLRMLFSWDTSWYFALAEHGYTHNSHEAIRFFPLLPLVTRTVAAIGIPTSVAILAVCWIAAFGFAVLIHRFTLLATGNAVTARRATWLSQLAPGAFVLTMGYTEAIAGLLATVYLLAVWQYGTDRRASRLWLWSVVGCVAGFGSGLVRPTGCLIAAVGGIDLLMRLIRRQPMTPADWIARLAMTLTPLAGVVSFLWWSDSVYGNFLLPYREQTLGGLRGGVASNPWTSFWQTFAVPGTHAENGGAGMMTLVLVVASLGLLWTCVRRLSPALSVWAALGLAGALTAPFFSSFPRYLSGDIPLIIAGAALPRTRGAWLWTVGASAAFCAFFAYRAFTGAYTP